MCYDILDRVKCDTLMRTLRGLIDEHQQDLFYNTIEEVLSDHRGLKIADLLKQNQEDAEKISKISVELFKAKQDLASALREEKQTNEALMQTNKMWQNAESFVKDLEQSLEDSQTEAAEAKEKLDAARKEPVFLREKIKKMQEEHSKELEDLKEKLKAAQAKKEEAPTDLASSLSMASSKSKGGSRFDSMADMLASAQQSFSTQEQFTIACSLLKGTPSTQVTKTAELLKAVVEDARPNLLKELLLLEHPSLGSPKMRLGAAQKLISQLPEEDMASVAQIIPLVLCKELAVKVLEASATQDAAGEEHSEKSFDPNIDLSKKCKWSLMRRFLKKLTSNEVKNLFDELGPRSKRSILTDIFDYQDPKDLELCAEMIFVERGIKVQSVVEFFAAMADLKGLELPALLQSQHAELLKRFEVQDDLLRQLLAWRPDFAGNLNGDLSHSLELRPKRLSALSSMNGHDSPPPDRAVNGKVAKAGDDGEAEAEAKGEPLRSSSMQGMPARLRSQMSAKKPQEDPTHRFLWRMVKNPIFESFFAVIVVANGIFIGLDTSYQAQNPNTRLPSLRIISYVFAAFFTCELCLRICAERRLFLQSEDWAWNALDVFIVLSSLWDVIVDIVEAVMQSQNVDSIAGMSGLKSFRIIRLTRLLRTAQFVRIFRFVMALRTLVTSIIHTSKALVWALVLLLLIEYVFAVLFTQVVNDIIAEGEVVLSPAESELALNYFGSLTDSMLTLFLCISGGVSWELVLKPLRTLSGALVACLLIYVFFTYFCVLNVVTAVFCQSAIESAQNDQLTVIQAMLLNKEQHIQKIQELFEKLGADESGVITLKIFQEHVNSPVVRAWFEALGLDVWDAMSFFKLLDSDGGGSVDVEEFFMGCLRFRGQARAMDVGKVIQDQASLMRQTGRFQHLMEVELRRLRRELRSLRGDGPKDQWEPNLWAGEGDAAEALPNDPSSKKVN
ncbi:unnamed protein product [Effrenium voratum]|nr:unnamed protein product [Effrenium voratum]